MFPCFRCNKKFNTADLLIHHLQNDHVLKKPGFCDPLQCKINNCNQLFLKYCIFRKHLCKTHENAIGDSFYEDFVSQNMVNPDFHSHEIQIEKACLVKYNSFDLDDSFNIQEYITDLKKKCLQLTLGLHSKCFMPRNEVTAIQYLITKLVSPISKALNYYSACNSETKEALECITSFLTSPFEEIKSEYRLFKFLKEMHLFEDPKSFTVSNKIGPKFKKGNASLFPNKIDIHIMPIKFQIKSFFELPNVLNLTLQNKKLLQNQGNLINFVNSETFANKLQNFLPDDIVITFFLYFDDFQINNALGAHVSSICGCYYSFPTLPQHLLSKLDFIFPFAYIPSHALKRNDHEIIFNHLFRELEELENGIEIQIPEGSKQIYFVLGLILGDNLGLNSIFGFVQSFKAKRFCRVCKRSSLEMKSDSEEHKEYLRDKNCYENDLEANNFLETGIKTVCIFNELKNFHVTENFYFDLMHDVLEGVCVYGICQTLNALINEKIVCLSTINSRKNLFSYGEIEIKNSSRPLELTKLKKNELRMTASEKFCFAKFLPLIIGDLIPESIQHWILFTKLLEIIDILFQNKFTTKDLKNLETKIKVHHELYVNLYGPTLKPKHHFLVHYPTAILKCGPLKYAWVMRFEAKHRASKAYLASITSRKNECRSVAIKQCLHFSSC
ncbi:uncharacterized protein LOC115634022 isoform X1 [Scaptodrosophila lebanonensis]|uniref:Uncharacterized protein LOC115623735 isoform X1 n=1 Tax=Drosophila lebanonensis TaxID=7225 RepID=A0A6J2TM39_DROLE|nr:uncharacterized protein LOC115623735 isoform X1 [Scaptodrosophila lebanonensis]XP_030374106.1 uncharacterized protein LOC115623735 isoform X1 [Scaptodrosophila lebanonensis]XP_030376082.1 uncharacterized protein LOC115625237 isoform X1 [Scaptodrosophila lebanonensis]XP_030376083.1 uncharacterized protein LOC115625237 isoform X1 [Scaptodrosophila lebanonensis]XP_030376086.1 uncharacterized protein LOC115625238 isoform X1 [Scaptodrosophila lebanonensis]XP_030376087.1 uncharacterized protein L